MTSERPYRPAISVDAALEELRSNAGTQFDAAIVEQLCNTTSLLTTPPEMPRPRTNTVRGTASV
jgi:HD-GYP domain-containing protein (c-di-GMP phosphodiesterase class II)